MRNLLLLLILALISTGPALADCSWRTNVKTEFNQSDLVFVGKVISANSLSPEPADGSSLGTTYKLSVVQQFRGDPKRSVLIFSEMDSGRFEMAAGETYVLFAKFDPKTLVGPAYRVYNCGFSGVARLSPKTLAMLRKLSKFPPSKPVERVLDKPN